MRWGSLAAATITLTAGCLLSAGTAYAQDDESKKRELVIGKWYPTLESGITLTQSSYSDNWSGGDRGSIVWAWILNATLENQLSQKVNTYNTLKLAYGQTHQQVVEDDGDRSWDRPEKSSDLIDFETIWRFTLGGFVDPFVGGRFESQFQDASDGFGRTLALNPLKFKETAGVAREFIAEEQRTLLSRVGFSFRQSARRLFDGPPPSEDTVTETANDGGIEWATNYSSKILDERISWSSKLIFYQPVFYSGKDELQAVSADSLAAYGLDSDIDAFTTTMDIEWENVFTSQITKVISVSLYTKFLYDKYDNTVAPELNAAGDGLTKPGDVRRAVRKAGQFKQTLLIGVTYRFI